MVQIYTGTRLVDSLFVTDSILINKELRAGVAYTITATPYWDFRAGVERELARVYITPPSTPTPPPPPTTTPTPTPTLTPTTPTDIIGLAAVIESLRSIITELSLKMTALEARLAPQVIDEGTLSPYTMMQRTHPTEYSSHITRTSGSLSALRNA